MNRPTTTPLFVHTTRKTAGQPDQGAGGHSLTRPHSVTAASSSLRERSERAAPPQAGFTVTTAPQGGVHPTPASEASGEEKAAGRRPATI